MPKLTIVREDGIVSVEGKGLEIETTDLPDFIHAIQWDGRRGHIEFNPDTHNNQMANLPIQSIAPFEYLLHRWEAKMDFFTKQAARAKADAEAKASTDAAAAQKAYDEHPLVQSAVQRKLEAQNGPTK